MGSIQIIHWIIVLLFVVGVLIPAAKVLSRVGINPWWAILSVIPLLNWIGLWVFAYARWPKVEAVRPEAKL